MKDPATADPSPDVKLFNNFVNATSFCEVLEHYKNICETLNINPTNVNEFFPKIKVGFRSWHATVLWSKYDEILKFRCYEGGRACSGTEVLVVGAGPCGLRVAIECQLLGARVVVVEKRVTFSRNNVLHLWPFVIQDLKRLGIKTFIGGKFASGSIEHISTRQLQLVLLKVALLLGVEVRHGVSFTDVIQPTSSSSGWRVKLSKQSFPDETFDAIIGATGKQEDILGFKKNEFRGKLAIAVTANFVNRHTRGEEAVEEISGVSYIYRQQFFKKLKSMTEIDLENIVYYKDDTHYFVMTAKRQSLVKRGVLIQDHKNTVQLLAKENINIERLKEFVIEAVRFTTDDRMPHYDFALNSRGKPDVAVFDFTQIRAAQNACRIVQRKGQVILLALVGDNLFEPFWPTGSGCARGFMSCFDAAWMIRNWASGTMTPLQVIAEREAVYKLLPQVTNDNIMKDYQRYTADPKSRYPLFNLQAIDISQVGSLYDSDTIVLADQEDGRQHSPPSHQYSPKSRPTSAGITKVEKMPFPSNGSKEKTSKRLLTNEAEDIHNKDLSTLRRNANKTKTPQYRKRKLQTGDSSDGRPPLKRIDSSFSRDYKPKPNMIICYPLNRREQNYNGTGQRTNRSSESNISLILGTCLTFILLVGGLIALPPSLAFCLEVCRFVVGLTASLSNMGKCLNFTIIVSGLITLLYVAIAKGVSRKRMSFVCLLVLLLCFLYFIWR